MRHDYIYNHLNAEEFLIVKRSAQWQQILDAIESIDANQFLKISNDKTRRGEVLYNQVAINDEFKRILGSSGWNEMKTEYYVTGDISTSKDIVREKDAEVQKRTIEERGHTAFSTYNQVDFVKDRIAIEVQFGKYFSVAYDLHVKHTFFFLRDEIDVGIEIIPTHAMMRRMDTGVSWFENEVTNVIREGRNNPSVPIVIIGIEPEDLIPETNATKRAETAAKRVEKTLEKVTKAEAKLTRARNARVPDDDKIVSAETQLEACRQDLLVAESELAAAQIDVQRTEELKAQLRIE
ncbi:MAG: hypothetical protein IKK05_05675 [Alistipes sp.]|nr:hypothetical protein [Alistipes sp.]